VRSAGSLLVTISNAGFYPDGGGALYTMSKHALVGLVRQLAFELAPAVRCQRNRARRDRDQPRRPRLAGMDQTVDLESGPRKIAPDFIPLGRIPSADEYRCRLRVLRGAQRIRAGTGSILNFDGGFGVRGLSRLSGGQALRDRFAGGK
jgi:cis-2,3-dihydrobiphenyl-2,3-diol dehydrogenase